MRVTASGLFTVILLMAPIAAVPLFAVFGVPELPLHVAATAFEWIDRAVSHGIGWKSHDESSAQTAAPRFSEIQNPGRRYDQDRVRHTPAGRTSHGEPFAADSNRVNGNGTHRTSTNDRRWNPMPESLGGWSLEPTIEAFDALAASTATERVGAAATSTSNDRGFAAVPLSSAAVSPEATPPRDDRLGPAPSVQPHSNRSQVTWQGAVHRLNELGIRQYRLEPGDGTSGFLFTCSFTSADNPRVTHRFEGEADEPLRAVERVIEQIDAWQKQ